MVGDCGLVERDALMLADIVTRVHSTVCLMFVFDLSLFVKWCRGHVCIVRNWTDFSCSFVRCCRSLVKKRAQSSAFVFSASKANRSRPMRIDRSFSDFDAVSDTPRKSNRSHRYDAG